VTGGGTLPAPDGATSRKIPAVLRPDGCYSRRRERMTPMNLKNLLLMAALAALCGCAAFEQTPDDLQRKISSPTKGRLYERDPEKLF
jgi:hypothetical protein